MTNQEPLDGTQFSTLVTLLDGIKQAADDDAISVCKQLAYAAKCVLLGLIVEDDE